MDNKELLHKVEHLVQSERCITAEILEYLQEVQNRRLHLDMGYSSLFIFLTKHLKYSDGAAYRRVEAMKLLRTAPELRENLINGKLSLSSAAKLQKITKTQNFKNGNERKAFLAKFAEKSSRQIERMIAELAPEESSRESLRQINAKESVLKITISNETRAKLEQLRAAHSHANPNLEWGKLLELLANEALTKLEKSRSPSITSPRSKAPNSATKPTTSAKAQIFARAEHRCEYLDQDSGRRCEAKHFLEVDHIVPRALGGSNELSNLQLLCRAHNQRKAELQLGADYMKRFRAAEN